MKIAEAVGRVGHLPAVAVSRIPHLRSAGIIEPGADIQLTIKYPHVSDGFVPHIAKTASARPVADFIGVAHSYGAKSICVGREGIGIVVSTADCPFIGIGGIRAGLPNSPCCRVSDDASLPVI